LCTEDAVKTSLDAEFHALMTRCQKRPAMKAELLASFCNLTEWSWICLQRAN